MATDAISLELILGRLGLVPDISAKKMFGEYGLYTGGKLFGLVCDNRLFIKPTTAGRSFAGELPEAAPYPGAKPCLLLGTNDDPEWLAELVRLTAEELPLPKPKKRKDLPGA